jgi:hypothetical protein
MPVDEWYRALKHLLGPARQKPSKAASNWAQNKRQGYFFFLGADSALCSLLASEARFFSLLTADTLSCFWFLFLRFDFGDLSPIIQCFGGLIRSQPFPRVRGEAETIERKKIDAASARQRLRNASESAGSGRKSREEP